MATLCLLPALTDYWHCARGNAAGEREHNLIIGLGNSGGIFGDYLFYGGIVR